MRTGRAARKPRGGAGPALEWRLFGVEVLLLEDAASGDYNREPSVSSALHEAVARQLQIEPEQLPMLQKPSKPDFWAVVTLLNERQEGANIREG